MKKHRCGETLHEIDQEGRKIGRDIAAKKRFETGWMRVKKKGQKQEIKERKSRSNRDALVPVQLKVDLTKKKIK